MGNFSLVATSGCRVYVMEILFQEKDNDCCRIWKKDKKNPALTKQQSLVCCSPSLNNQMKRAYFVMETATLVGLL